MPNYIRQCELRADNHVTVSWLPEKLAILGNALTFRDDSRKWMVTEVYERVEEDRLSRKHHTVTTV